MSRPHCRTFPSNLPPRLFGMDSQTQRAGSETPWAAYAIGYPRTVAQASIRLLSSQSLSHPVSGQFLFNLNSLHLEPLGLPFPTLHILSLSPSLFSNLCL